MDGNLVVGAIIVLLIIGAVAVLVRNKLRGKSSCGCGGCSGCGCCHTKTVEPTDDQCKCCSKKH